MYFAFTENEFISSVCVKKIFYSWGLSWAIRRFEWLIVGSSCVTCIRFTFWPFVNILCMYGRLRSISMKTPPSIKFPLDKRTMLRLTILRFGKIAKCSMTAFPSIKLLIGVNSSQMTWFVSHCPSFKISKWDRSWNLWMLMVSNGTNSNSLISRGKSNYMFGKYAFVGDKSVLLWYTECGKSTA